jgi:hypothetical protein
MEQELDLIWKRQPNRVDQRQHHIFHQTLVDQLATLSVKEDIIIKQLRLENPGFLFLKLFNLFPYQNSFPKPYPSKQK